MKLERFLLFIYFINGMKKVMLSLYRPGQALRARGGEFQDNQHMKVERLSSLGNDRLYPKGIHLVLISVRG
jgi:hypothetical protein